MVRASLGAAGGSFNASTAVNETYPMYVLPIATLLEMTEWIPHQELLAQNKLVKLSEVEADASEVIFLSHQWVWPAGNHASSSPTPLAHPRVLFDTYIRWCSFLHPDPKGDQLRPLQDLVRRLVGGDIVVRTRPELEMMFGYKKISGKDVWEALPASGYVWHE